MIQILLALIRMLDHSDFYGAVELTIELVVINQSKLYVVTHVLNSVQYFNSVLAFLIANDLPSDSS